jgi:hypothetical protein
MMINPLEALTTRRALGGDGSLDEYLAATETMSHHSTVMLLVTSDKCQGLGDRVPKIGAT